MLKDNTCPKKILEFMKNKRELRLRDIIKNFQIFSNAAIIKSLKLLLKKGYIIQPRYGMYKIKDEFREIEKDINIKCPNCGYIFNVKNSLPTADCPNCSREVLNVDFNEVETND